MLDHSNLAQKGVRGWERRRGTAYLSERTLTYTSQEEEMEEIGVSFKVDGLRNETGGGGGGGDGGLTGGRQQRAPIGGGEDDERGKKQTNKPERRGSAWIT